VTEWNKDLVLHRVARASETLEDARILANTGRWNACVNRLYYACFYALSALLVRHGLSSSKHTGVRSLFNHHYVKTGNIPKDLARTYNDLFERRQEGDYIDFVRFQESQVRPWVSEAERLVEYVRFYLWYKLGEIHR
jgi:uncharacterized protein (UPF0332 family)